MKAGRGSGGGRPLQNPSCAASPDRCWQGSRAGDLPGFLGGDKLPQQDTASAGSTGRWRGWGQRGDFT